MPAGLGSGKHALEVRGLVGSGKVRLAINALLVKGWLGEQTLGKMAAGKLT